MSLSFSIKNKFTKELPSDPIHENTVRKVFESAFSYVPPTPPKNPILIHANISFANKLGISKDDVESDDFLSFFSGKKIYPKTTPFSMCYGGHQFGVWAGQLGDGRAINLFEIENHNKQYTLQLKGAGKTPYSRNADGLAVLRSSIREYLCAEAMNALGIPTTRSLSIISTGNDVLRDILYNGNPAYEKGAIVCRVAPSFIRFGNFELFASRNDFENLQLLTDFTIKHYFPEIKTSGKEAYIHFFKLVAQSTLKLVTYWQQVGFVHGVMNTDNMSIHGITIDYGPYGWLENYNPNWTPNTTDAHQHRYAFGNQPQISLWNLYQLANALYPLINETEELEQILNKYENEYENNYINMMQKKLGLTQTNDSDRELIYQLINLLELTETDYTIFFRLLGNVLKEKTSKEAFQAIEYAFYEVISPNSEISNSWLRWFQNYLNRINLESLSNEERKEKMNLINPKYILRNYMAQLAIEKAELEDYSLLNELYEVIQKPYDEQPEYQKWFAKRPDWAKEKIGCSQLSCSS
ncbi:YdiU family protein [Flavobacterium oreochromis]|uniref:protein adenylyltransferase SelO n=1 Tax=Flavobacterium oreochromis TaxID=2906078 RepID=UPI00385D05D2